MAIGPCIEWTLAKKNNFGSLTNYWNDNDLPKNQECITKYNLLTVEILTDHSKCNSKLFEWRIYLITNNFHIFVYSIF